MLVALTLAITVTSCVPSPTTTYRADSGITVTVDWADYPGHAGMDAADVLRAPPAEEIRTVSASILGEIEARLSDEFALEWEDGPYGNEGRLYSPEGNGYGGESLYVTFNSGERESLGIPSRVEDWTRIMELISDVTSAHGLGALKRETIDPERAAENAERSGSDDPAAQWQWSGSAFGDSQWLSVSMNDIDRDRSGKAAEMIGVDDGWNPRSVQISYGATTLGSKDRVAFLDRIEPFEGLPLPKPTTSD